MEKTVPIDGNYDPFTPDAVTRVETLEGSKAGEGGFMLETEGEVSLVFNDTLFNVPHIRGPKGWLVRLVGSTGGPRVTRLAQWALVDEKNKLANHLWRLIQLPGLKRLIPGHGDIIETDAADTLARVAHRLGNIRPMS